MIFNSLRKSLLQRTALLFASVMLLSMLFTWSCTSDNGATGITEGTIHYEVSYPYYEGIMASVLPDEMTLQFKDDRYVTELASGAFFKTNFVADYHARELTLLLKVINAKHVSTLDALSTRKMLEEFPTFTLSHTGRTDTVAGFLCKEVVCIYDDISKPEMLLYYTNDIDIKNSNWCNQYPDIDGVLMAYEIDQFGLRTRFRATAVTTDKVDDAIFSFPDDYEIISGDDMRNKMRALFNDL